MAIEIPGFRPGMFKAGADLRTKQFFAVKLDASGDLVLAGNNEEAIGVLQNKPNTGQGCELERDGVTQIIAGEAIAINDKLASDANGKLKTAVSGSFVIGRALTTIAADLDMGSMIMETGHIIP